MRSDVSRVVFGSFDGVTSVVGLLAGLLAAHALPSELVKAVTGLAVASAIGMAAGDWLANANGRNALTIGAATLAGTLGPALPVELAPGRWGLAGGAAMVAVFAVLMSEIRADLVGRWRGYVHTLAVLAVGGGASTGAALLLGGAG